MTPEDAAYCVLHGCDRRDPRVKRVLDEEDRRLGEQHQQLLRDDPAYAQAWRASLQQMADRIDDAIAAKVYADLK